MKTTNWTDTSTGKFCASCTRVEAFVKMGSRFSRDLKPQSKWNRSEQEEFSIRNQEYESECICCGKKMGLRTGLMDNAYCGCQGGNPQ